MAAISKIAREYADDIRDGIAWVIIWKDGRSWNATSVWLTIDDTFESDDMDTVKEILEADPSAVMLNGYYCGHFGEDMTAAEIEAGIRWHYENGYNLLNDSTAFPPEPMARPADLPADLPWYGRATSSEPDPYVYDGYMSLEDYELMHKNIEADRQAEETPATVTLELEISQEQAAAIVQEIWPIFERAVECVAQALREFVDWAREVFRKVAAKAKQTINEHIDALLYSANDHPKWWHLYKHAKKARTRKKYRRRLMQQLGEKLAAGMT